MQRRPIFLGGLAALATPGATQAQSVPGKVWRIGVLSQFIPKEAFVLRPALAALGYVEGRNLAIDFRFAQGNAELLPGLAAQLVADKVDLLIGLANPDAAALKRATTAIPVVMMYVSEPVDTGLIASLANPGGNLTGTTVNTFEVAGKMTQMLRDTVPGMSRLVWLADPDYPGMASYWKYASQAASAMGLRASLVPVRTMADLDTAMAGLERDRPDAIGVSTTGVLTQHSSRVIEFAARLKLPALYSTSGPVRAGGLMNYGPDFDAIHSRVAWIIDKILKGAKPRDIPVEEPARFSLIINMKSAKAMGLVIPPIVLLQATELIE